METTGGEEVADDDEDDEGKELLPQRPPKTRKRRGSVGFYTRLFCRFMDSTGGEKDILPGSGADLQPRTLGPRP